MTCLKIVSDNCFDTTGAASAGLPGLTTGEQIGGKWKSIAEIEKKKYYNKMRKRREREREMGKHAANLYNPHLVFPLKGS